MKKNNLGAIAAAALVMGSAAASAAVLPSAVAFEPEPCVLTLNSSYTIPADGAPLVLDPKGALSCPAAWVSFDAAEASTTLRGGIYFQNSSTPPPPGTRPYRSPSIEGGAISSYDPVSNSLVRTPVFLLTADVPGTWDSILQSTGDARYEPYLQDSSDPGDRKNYRLVLARPFTTAEGVAAAPTCTFTPAAKYTYTWGQGPGFPLPDSAITCTGGLNFNSAGYYLSISFDSRFRDQGHVYDVKGDLNSTTNAFAAGGMWLDTGFSDLVVSAGQPQGLGSTSSFGRFRASASGSWVESKATGERYKVTLASSFTVKRGTTLAAKARRFGSDRLKVTISADRNASFQNTGVPLTYRRQTVLPASPQDHAVVRRGGKVVARVTLSPYGKGAVNVPDAPGSNAYSVTMVETDSNYQAVVRFKR